MCTHVNFSQIICNVRTVFYTKKIIDEILAA
jgi:hypothetical protein